MGLRGGRPRSARLWAGRGEQGGECGTGARGVSYYDDRPDRAQHELIPRACLRFVVASGPSCGAEAVYGNDAQLAWRMMQLELQQC